MKPKEILGRLFGQFRRGWQRFNAENRAFRELDKQKTHHVAAPKYPVNLKYLEDTAKGNENVNNREPTTDHLCNCVWILQNRLNTPKNRTWSTKTSAIV